MSVSHDNVLTVLSYNAQYSRHLTVTLPLDGFAVVIHL
jgi:hypothetical protein